MSEKNSIDGMRHSIIKILREEAGCYLENLIDAKNKFNWEAQEKVLLSSYNNILNGKI